MERMEILAAAVYQAWVASEGGAPVDWQDATDERRSAVYHAVRFLMELEPLVLPLDQLCEASKVAWGRWCNRCGYNTLSSAPVDLMVRTYCACRGALNDC